MRILRAVALFQGLTSVQLADIRQAAEKVSFKTGEAIITDGEPGNAAFVILSGACQRTHGPAVSDEPQPVAAGSLIGEMAMLIETNYSSTVVCQGPVQTLKISRTVLYALLAEDPDLAEHFVAKITRRLHAIADELRRLDTALATPPQRPMPRLLLPAPASRPTPAP